MLKTLLLYPKELAYTRLAADAAHSGMQLPLGSCSYGACRGQHEQHRASSLDVPAGMLKTLLLYPMELAYTRLAADAAPRGTRPHYFGLLGCILQVCLHRACTDQRACLLHSTLPRAFAQHNGACLLGCKIQCAVFRDSV